MVYRHARHEIRMRETEVEQVVTPMSSAPTAPLAAPPAPTEEPLERLRLAKLVADVLAR